MQTRKAAGRATLLVHAPSRWKNAEYRKQQICLNLYSVNIFIHYEKVYKQVLVINLSFPLKAQGWILNGGGGACSSLHLKVRPSFTLSQIRIPPRPCRTSCSSLNNFLTNLRRKVSVFTCKRYFKGKK